MKKLEAKIKDFLKALDRFIELDAFPRSDIIRDATVKRFEILFDISWKTLKTILNEENSVFCNSPKTCIREAFKQGWIDQYENFWIEMCDLRNRAAHTYDLKVGEDIYKERAKITKCFEDMKKHIILSDN